MTLVVSSLRAEYRSDSPVVAVPSPRLSWKTAATTQDWMQAGAELEWTAGGKTTSATITGPESHLVAWPFADLAPRSRGELRVRVTGRDGLTSGWSDPMEIVAGFLGTDEWTARFIGLQAPQQIAQPMLARSTFTVEKGLVAATLYASAHGVYQAEVNGAPVDAEILKPGWTPYQWRLVHETTDITGLLQAGKNAIGAAVAGGWYTERYGFQGLDRPLYGEQVAFAALIVLEYDNGSRVVLETGESWRVTAGAPTLSSGIYAGESFDARRVQPGWSSTDFEAEGWEVPSTIEENVTPTPRSSPAVRAIETLPVRELTTSPSGMTLLDFGQNLVGRLRIRVSGPAGTTIVLRHAEVLENGELGVRPLRRADATDSYTLSGTGVEEWEPQFTFHGFRYAEVTGWPGRLDPADISAVVIHSDMERTGWFSSSNAMVDRLHENVVWSMRGNFLSLPTDCPQRDERLGWTGDIQVFSPTASYLYECDGFLASWLTDLAIEQEAGGGVPFVVPDVLDSAATPTAAWGDAATLVPWTLYERFGDRGVLSAQYDSMKAWVDLVLSVAGPSRLWEGRFQFGDWLDPDAPTDRPDDAKADSGLVATAYLFKSSQVLGRAAALLGRDDAAAHYLAIAEQVRSAWLAQYVSPAGRIVSDAQTSYSLAIVFGIPTDPEVLGHMGRRLAWLVRRDGYRIGTGFVGTPLVADALSSTGHLDAATRLLLQTENPSWLYPVTMGATTIWERWDSMLEDGSINPGEMTSFNHYSLGAIADWLHRVVTGLSPLDPGYRKIGIAPQPIPGLDWAETAHETPYGPARVRWEAVDDGQVKVTAVVPPNTTARVTLPGGRSQDVGSGSYEWVVADPRQSIVPAQHSRNSSLAQIIDDPEAYMTVLGAMRRADPALAEDFRRRTSWIDEQALIGAFTMWPRAVVTEVDRALEELNSRRGA